MTSDSESLLGPLRVVLRSCASVPNEVPWRVSVRYGSEPHGWRDRPLRLYWGGQLRGGIPAEYYTAQGRRIVCLPGRAWGHLDCEHRAVEIFCGAGQEAYAYDGCLVPLLCELLAHHGHFVIHAASLAFERNGAMAGVLLAGASGIGKTTNALVLARSGMILLSDDASFITPRGPNDSMVDLWGLQLACKVHDNTRRFLPWLDGCPARSARTNDETRLDVTTVVGESTGMVVVPRLLLLLGPRSEGEHVLTPLDKTQDMMRLTSENVRAYEHQGDGSAGNAFRALGQLVAQCEIYRLCVGEPLSTLPERIHRLLECPI